jgi:hypothetical protein
LNRLKYYISIQVMGLFVIMFAGGVSAVITGQCSDCHTMHNSQNGAVMVDYTYGAETTDAKEYLLRGSCLGCHAQGSPDMVATINGNDVPQVYHTDPSGDLAGGNFAYILGTKGSGASDGKGHNVIDFGNIENTLTGPPGNIHPDFGVNITCAGTKGCHGNRIVGGGIKGAHHNNVDGQLDVADEVYKSYRFLNAVKGLEDADWEKTESASDHNEYFGKTTPMTFAGNCNICHHGLDGVYPNSSTISGFCGTCHRDFHTTDFIGGTSSPFTRHPTDVLLPGGSTEYADYNGPGNPYSLLAPVARTTVPATPGSTVTPGSDVIMCLSCHAAHGTDNNDMMRWNYKSATLATALSGCNVCHTAKD